MDWRTLFLSPEGRIGQRDFWLGFLILFGLWCVLHFLWIFGHLLQVVLIYGFVCLYSKRLHDMGRSGFLQLIPIAIGLVCGVIGTVLAGAGLLLAMLSGHHFDAAGAIAGGLVFFALSGVAVLVGLAFLLWVGLTGGEAGDNRYGPAQTGSLFDSPVPPSPPHPPMPPIPPAP